MVARSLRFVEPRTVSVERTDIPTPAADDVLVQSRCSLVSGGTELLIYRGEAPPELEADPTIPALDGDLSFPLTYGYANVGDVIEVGAAVSREWEGRTVFAFHPHESHFTTGTEMLFPVPETVPVEDATFLPFAETAVNLVLDGAPRIGEQVVVFGAGLVGLLTVATLAEFPLERLTVVEPLASRRERALQLGADDAIAPPAIDDDPGGADLLYELSGAPDALDEAIERVRYDGRVVVGSWYGQKRADLDLGGTFHRDRITITSSQVSTIAPELRGRWTTERRMDVAWRQLHSLPVEELRTHRVPITEAERAYELLDSHPEDALGVLFTYD